jgi:hypothetical protein
LLRHHAPERRRSKKEEKDAERLPCRVTLFEELSLRDRLAKFYSSKFTPFTKECLNFIKLYSLRFDLIFIGEKIRQTSVAFISIT